MYESIHCDKISCLLVVKLWIKNISFEKLKHSQITLSEGQNLF